MQKLLPSLFFVLILPAALYAQTNETLPCPTVSVAGQSFLSKPNEPIKFSANVDANGKDLKLEYIWFVSNGKIIEGQGTSAIKVEHSWSKNLTVTIKVKGFPNKCPNTDSESMVIDPAPQAVKIDEFGIVTNAIIKSRFDNFMNRLFEDPNARAYIINYGSVKDVAKRERAITNSISFLKIDAIRITIVRGGFRKQLKTQLWIVPSGAISPKIQDNY
jgi:hypothetical protein